MKITKKNIPSPPKQSQTMKELQLLKSDPYLLPYESAIKGRYDYFVQREKELTGGVALKDWANGFLYYGLHHQAKGWVLREWAPNATAIYLIGDATKWQKDEKYRFQPLENGVWELQLKEKQLEHGQLYKLWMEWQGGAAERIPSYATRVVQDDNTKIFSAQVWNPEPYKWKHKTAKLNFKKQSVFIYECHIGMSGEDERVTTYNEFRENVLPRVASLGYNCLQIMAIQEHPYYGSFGYHVSNFFAASSRFGTPEELKHLIDEAHGLGIAVIMDIVHSHAVKNELDGLALFDGTPYQYFHTGGKREHPSWDSLCFNYQKPEVVHFLLSNCKFWLTEYGFDGFRFDGVTSMMYLSHGLNENFVNYDCYFNANEDGDAICYLTLANKLIHQVNPNAITIAEDMSGMPGLAYPINGGGMGFNYRLAMGIPDFWIKYLKEVRDEDWNVEHVYYELTNRRQDEQTISYAESHDQALVGDKTIIFRLIDADMYWFMAKDRSNFMVDRGIAMHKMIRLITASTINGGYLNFMGNEFGHPEWIDFPREGNGWSYKYAKRQWHLVDDGLLRYGQLNEFDKAMVHLLRSELPMIDDENGLHLPYIYKLCANHGDQVLAYRRGDLLFVFNWNGNQSFVDYGIMVDKGKYQIILDSDAPEFGGFGRNDDSIIHQTIPVQSELLNKGDNREWLRLYLPARSAMVLKKIK